MERPNWDEFFFMLAHIYSTRGTCDRLKTATLLVRDKRIVGAGYNGSLPGNPQCDEVGHLMIDGHCLRTLHGEDNAILYSTADLKNSTAYILGTPCILCITKLIAKGINTIKFLGEYSNARGKEEIEKLVKQNNVELMKIDFDFDDTLNKMRNVLEGPGGALR
jgi:dCMP deaminase